MSRPSARLLVAATLTPLCFAGADAASAASRACAPVVNPYPNTRYEGVDLTSIRATGVTCATARTVARRAHSNPLGMTPTESGIRRFTWNGWRVRADLRGESDRYTATRDGDRVTWRF